MWLKCKGKPAKYVHGGVLEMLNPGQENLSSFLLAWTLFYGKCLFGMRFWVFYVADSFDVLGVRARDLCSPTQVTSGRFATEATTVPAFRANSYILFLWCHCVSHTALLFQVSCMVCLCLTHASSTLTLLDLLVYD